ncbi:hypothetical protein evm_001468 [Chilo suppressalis]|nr:hypothetical protein evm_001468 [Chilo suppressalis]
MRRCWPIVAHGRAWPIVYWGRNINAIRQGWMNVRLLKLMAVESSAMRWYTVLLLLLSIKSMYWREAYAVRRHNLINIENIQMTRPRRSFCIMADSPEGCQGIGIGPAFQNNTKSDPYGYTESTTNRNTESTTNVRIN